MSTHIYFDLDGTRAHKTDLLAYALNENPSTTQRIMISDRKHDLIGARTDGIHPIGVSYGYGSRAELNAAGAMAIAESPADIPVLVAQYANRQE